MKKITKIWLSKADEDYSVAAGIVRRRKIPANTVCFHCQQAAEKYLKGFLQENMVRFTKTHDLLALLDLARTKAPQLGLLLDDFKLLNRYAVAHRYPGSDADPKEAKGAVAAARRIRATILPLIQ